MKANRLIWRRVPAVLARLLSGEIAVSPRDGPEYAQPRTGGVPCRIVSLKPQSRNANDGSSRQSASVLVSMRSKAIAYVNYTTTSADAWSAVLRNDDARTAAHLYERHRSPPGAPRRSRQLWPPRSRFERDIEACARDFDRARSTPCGRESMPIFRKRRPANASTRLKQARDEIVEACDLRRAALQAHHQTSARPPRHGSCPGDRQPAETFFVSGKCGGEYRFSRQRFSIARPSAIHARDPSGVVRLHRRMAPGRAMSSARHPGTRRCAGDAA